MYDRTAADELLIAEALVTYGYQNRNDEPEQARRAWVLAAELASTHGLDVEAVLRGGTRLDEEHYR